MSCINLGIGMTKVHTTDEFITVESLEQSARLTAELDAEVGAGRQSKHKWAVHWAAHLCLDAAELL